MRYKIVTAIAVLVLLATACTENPFFGDQVIVEKNLTITGNINVAGEEDNSGVFVWMEGLDIHTVTDISGNFTIEIPKEPQFQSGGGLTGFYKLYYFVNNYRLKYSDVFLYRGQFEYGSGDVNSVGEISKPLSLTKLLDISATVKPSSIDTDFNDNLNLYIYLTTLTDSVVVETYKTTIGQLGQAYLVDKNSAPDTTMKLFQSSGRVRETIWGGKTWFMSIPWERGKLMPGQYEISPYIVVVQDLPEGLLRRFYKDFQVPDTDYIDFPIKQQPAVLKVLEPQYSRPL